MDFFTSMTVSASGLNAQRTRINVASSNLANVSTTQTAAGGPYQRRDVVLGAVPVENTADTVAPPKEFADAVRQVEVTDIVKDQSPPQMEYDPGHPDANKDGLVAYPNINVVEEMVNMITASRAYEAGLNAIKTATKMAESAMRIGKGG